MMISNNSTTVYGTSKLIENGLPPNEDEILDDVGPTETVRDVAARVVDVVVRMASEAAQNANQKEKTAPPKTKGCNLPRLPTIQIDTVPSAPPSPDESSLQEITEENELLDENEIQIDLGSEERANEISEDLKESVKSYVENLLQEAMVVAEKKLQFAGLPEEDEDESAEEEQEPEPEEVDDSEIRACAEKVVEEIIAMATETIAERREKEIASLTFPALPTFQIDTVKSAPPSPESPEEETMAPKKWTFRIEDEETDSEKSAQPQPPVEKKTILITFDEAPEDVKELATNMVKEILGKAVALAEEKAVPTVPFNFEDVDLMKTSGPWYIRAREALVRVLRTACFCTPRRNDS